MTKIKEYFALPDDTWGNLFAGMMIVVPILIIGSEVITHIPI